MFRRSNKKGFTGVELIVLVAISGLILFFSGPNIGKGINNIFQGGKNKTKAEHKISESYPIFYKNDKGEFIPTKIPYSRIEESSGSIVIDPPETLWEKFWKLGAMAVVVIVVLSYLGLWPIVALWWNKVIKPKIVATQTRLEEIKEQHGALRGDAKIIVKSIDNALGELQKHIDSAKGQVDSALSALNQTSLIADPTQRQAAITLAQNNLLVVQTVYFSVVDMKKDFKASLDREQDSTTKLLVAELKND